ncbi:gliding motility-associated C-terminal domain-containing protein [Crocinitomix sp.]|nr:gliding motility-associated C-terminal domain-containing protein [Crocinitomix sp.]
MLRSITYLVLFLLLPLASFATHNRSGSITYVHVEGMTYRFTVKTCTKLSSEADRPEIEIRWGDGQRDTLLRSDIDSNLVYDVQINTYIGLHTFTGPSTYIIQVEDPNRNAGVINITNSVDKVFCIQTELVISPFIGAPNNSLIIEDCPCPEFACVNQLYCYTVSAYDPDGDSLSYSLVPCRGEGCLEMSMPAIYRYPNEAAGGEIYIDQYTGTICWDYPEVQGTYNIAIKVSEYRNGIYIGSVLQDMQFEVIRCFHDPPIVEEFEDTCIYAGSTLDFPVIATDVSDGVSVFATGAVFNLTDNPAVFTEASGPTEAIGNFNWTPNCDQASNSYYLINFHAEDHHPAVQLSDVSHFRIKVNIPPVENLIVNPIGNTMDLSWDPSVCDDIVSYNIYRSIDSSEVTNDCCDKGGALSMGYSLVGTSTTPSYIDSGVLIVGNEYCYMITAVNSKGVESCLSEQICAHLNFEIPVLTHVSISTTDGTIGEDSVYWAYPKELNTDVFPGPYYYRLYRKEGIPGGAETVVYTSEAQVSIINPDTVFYDNGLNTEGFPYTYRVELFSNDALVGGSISASSIYITTIPNDNQLEIIWEENTPWTNTSYEIYRETPLGSGVFDLIGTSTVQSYIDNALVNGAEYCYMIKSIGGYTADGIVNPIENWSQITCGTPIDLTPPCPPTISIDGDCDLEETYLNWTNPNNDCADDVTRYNLYFAPFSGDSLIFLKTINSQFDTSFVHKDRGSIAGCYYITALDSIQYNNESEPSNIVCIDNCDGYYELPNIFSPNGDGKNDLFQPLLPFKFVDSIEIAIQNRWGMNVFETTDPYIYWDGKNQKSDEMSTDGVYFYSIIVYEIRLEGLVPRAFQGNIQIINGTR